jgi:hypothetical protein
LIPPLHRNSSRPRLERRTKQLSVRLDEDGIT